MALNQVGLERLNTATTKKIGINKNLVINGAMQIAQRGTSSTTNGYSTIDRFNISGSGVDEAITQAQVDISSSDTPYTLGFKKALKITNGNQTSGAGATDAVLFEYKSESQDIATSGWNFKSATSFLTMSFWVKSSVAQEFQCQLYNSDTNKAYLFTYTVASADTWQKITHSVKGDSNLNFNVDNGAGLECAWYLFIGTDQTVANPTENTWATYSGTSTKKDAVSTWYTTNDATFEITGVQWEVGSVATDFEHRSVGQELALCKRYFQPWIQYAEYVSGGTGNLGFPYVAFSVPMRASPTFTSDHESKSSNWSFASMQVQGSDTVGYYAHAISYNTTDSNYGYMRKYGGASAEL